MHEVDGLFLRGDTLKDINGNPTVVSLLCPITDLTLTEKWKFDQNKERKYGSLTSMIVSRKIYSIGLNSTCFDDVSKRNKYYKTGWLKFKDLDQFMYFSKGKGTLYKEVLDAPLFKKLDICYY